MEEVWGICRMNASVWVFKVAIDSEYPWKFLALLPGGRPFFLALDVQVSDKIYINIITKWEDLERITNQR